MKILRIASAKLKISHRIACINMTMPRPSGKAQKIAEQTVPGLNQNMRGSSKKKSKEVPKDDVELKMVKINENRGRLR